jgi:class 3 adenylate cyclase
VMDLQLDNEAMRQPAPALAATIMTTLREAVAEAVRRQAGIVDDSFGDAFGVDTADHVRQAQAEAFGTAEDDHASHQSEPARRPRRDDDDDFSENTIY